VTASAVEHHSLSVFQIALALAIPTGVMILMIFVTWSVLMRSVDWAHVPLFLLSVAPLVAAVGVAHLTGSLVAVIGLVTLSPVVQVVSHELVGYRHTIRVIERSV
jgi:hypothetical protein